jgi:hypothetical protein
MDSWRGWRIKIPSVEAANKPILGPKIAIFLAPAYISLSSSTSNVRIAHLPHEGA